MKIDPYGHEQRYRKWRKSVEENGIPEVGKYNSDLILQYLDDMEYGLNVSIRNAKGSRSYPRLNTLRQKLIFSSKKFKEIYNLDKITDISEIQIFKFFTGMRKGDIRRADGKIYASTGYYVKVFKAFWHWYIKVNKKLKIEIKDITEDLDSKEDKPRWVYLDEKQIKMLCDNALHKYKVLIMFLFDTGIRSPTELVNIKVSDLYNDFKELEIREAKTFSRRIKLMLCSDLIRGHVEENNLKESDYLFPIHPGMTNRYLKRLASRILGDGISPAGQKYSDLTMYDFRHCSCCYWLPRYKSESALKYRFGWKKSDKIHYYSEMLGMSDTIAEEDMFVDTTKTELEQKLEVSEGARDILQERIRMLEGQMVKILGMVEEDSVITS